MRGLLEKVGKNHKSNIMKKLSYTTKVVLGLAVVGLGYYLWWKQYEKKKVAELKDGANTPA